MTEPQIWDYHAKLLNCINVSFFFVPKYLVASMVLRFILIFLTLEKLQTAAAFKI